MDDNKPYCYAPFVHMHIHPNTPHKLCCVAEGSVYSDIGEVETRDDGNLKERWNSDFYKKYRELFLSKDIYKRPPSVCKRCIDNENAGMYSDRKMFETAYGNKDLTLDIVSGNQYNAPLDIDLRPGNLCNLKCRMCVPDSSSQLDKEVKENRRLLSFLNTVNEETDVSNTLNEKDTIDWLFSAAEHGERVKLLGGEPTIMPEVHSILDYLNENGKNDVKLSFTTNITNNNPTFISKIEKFNHNRFSYSIDGTGKVVEYIRYPVKWESIQKNIKLYDSVSSFSMINFALQAYNILNIKDFLYWLEEHNKTSPLEVMPRFEVLTLPEWASYRSIPKKVRDEYLNNLLKDDIINRQVDSKYNAIKEVITRILDDDVEYQIERLAMITKRFDIARNQHIKDYIPEVWEIIEEAYNDLRIRGH